MAGIRKLPPHSERRARHRASLRQWRPRGLYARSSIPYGIRLVCSGAIGCDAICGYDCTVLKKLVAVISQKVQEFAGERYYLCGKYFQRNGVRLHCAVWEHVHGRPVPRGHHVHHKDGNRSNNEPGNLQLLSQRDHLSIHGRRNRRTPVEAIKAAVDWHKSKAGHKWHREQYERYKHLLHADKQFTCEQCGASFKTADVGINRFCRNSCKSAWRRDQGLDNETRTCLGCGAPFVCSKYRKTQCCSRKCGGKVSGEKKRGRRRRVLPDGSGYKYVRN